MSKIKQIELKGIEVAYLLSLAYSNKTDGVYWGRKDYFEARQDRVIKELENALKEGNDTSIK